MKTTLSVIAIAFLLAACTNSPQPGIGNANVAGVQIADTVGFAEYKNWKAQKDLLEFNEYKQAKYTAIVAGTPTRPVLNRRSTNAVKSKTVSERRGSGSASTSTSYPAKAPKKKGWSKAAKGTAIGAGSGAVIGAVVNKRNRAVGAVIGGVSGGAVGYGIGRHMDKKDGR